MGGWVLQSYTGWPGRSPWERDILEEEFQEGVARELVMRNLREADQCRNRRCKGPEAEVLGRL